VSDHPKDRLPRSRGTDVLLWSGVVLAGFLSLAVELSVSRLLRPWFGDMLFVWAAVIGFVLLYLTLGNLIGSRLDSRRAGERLPWIVGLAGVGIYLIPWLTRPLLEGTQRALHSYHLALPLQAFLLVLLLLAWPLTLLGTVSPQVVGYWTAQGKPGHRAAGEVLALGTLASLAGAMLPVFWFLPTWGTRRTFALLGLLALAWSGAALLLRRTHRFLLPLWLILPLLLPPTHLAGPIKPFDPTGRGRVLYETESAYNYIQVIQWREERWLRLNEGEGLHSVWRPHMRLSYGIWDFFLLAPTFRPLNARPVENLLVIGLAGGTIPTLYHHTFAPSRMVGVELDPEVVRVAYTYFHLGDLPTLEAVTGDGRVYLREGGEKFQVIALDAYRPPYIPFHLTTVEFFREVDAHLTPDGVVMVNAARTREDFRLVHALARTMKAVFPQVLIVDEPLNGASWGNSVVVGMKTPISKAGVEQVWEATEHPVLREVIQRAQGHLRDAPDEGLVLWDDRAPVEEIVHGILWAYLWSP